MLSGFQNNVAREYDRQLASNGRKITIKPSVDIYETGDSIVVLAEMPGIMKENLNVKVEDGVLHISGQRENPKIDGEYLMRETDDVFFHRAFELEEDLNPEKIVAEYNHGILKVTIGKKEKAKPKVIQIN
jgi:HSP20 family protein